MEIKGDTLLEKSKGLIEANLGESLALMSIDSGKYFGMNQVGKHIWKALDKETSFDDLISKLTDLFEVDKATCEDNCKSFLSELQSKGMITLKRN